MERRNPRRRTYLQCNQLWTENQGTGLGTAALGWILAAGNYNGTAAVQPDSAIFAIKSLFLYLPLAITVVVLIIWYLFMGIDKVYPTVRKELDERRKNAKQN